MIVGYDARTEVVDAYTADVLGGFPADGRCQSPRASSAAIPPGSSLARTLLVGAVWKPRLRTPSLVAPPHQCASKSIMSSFSLWGW
jgi:hypothetical protein